LFTEQYQELPAATRSLLVDHPNTVDSSSDEDEQENRGYVATNRCKKFLKETLNADTIIVSCGMLNFEAPNYANGSSTEFIDWQGNAKVTPSYFERYPEARKKFLRSFEKNYPELVADRNVILSGCTTFVDPGHDRSLRSHLGTHHESFRKILDSKNFTKVNEPLKDLRKDMKNLVIDVCKSGRHRSFALNTAQIDAIKVNLYNDDETSVIDSIDLQAETHWGRLCGSDCPHCDTFLHCE